MSWLLWGLLIFPLLGKYLMGSEPDIFTIFLSLVASYIVMAFPIHLDLPKVPDGKEYYLFFYPIISIPIIFGGIKIREFLM